MFMAVPIMRTGSPSAVRCTTRPRQKIQLRDDRGNIQFSLEQAPGKMEQLSSNSHYVAVFMVSAILHGIVSIVSFATEMILNGFVKSGPILGHNEGLPRPHVDITSREKKKISKKIRDQLHTKSVKSPNLRPWRVHFSDFIAKNSVTLAVPKWLACDHVPFPNSLMGNLTACSHFGSDQQKQMEGIAE
jgi:hypothetical protein